MENEHPGRRDLLGRVWYAGDFRLLAIHAAFSKAITMLIGASRGVTIGESCSFYGTPLLRRFPESEIIIGPRCRFRSSARSNLVGLNHRCIIGTHASNARITIGEGSGFSGTVIGSACEISIGSHVLCGGNSFITDFDWHAIADRQSPDARPQASAVRIEDDVWIGYNAVILKGVTIGAGTVVGANSVVTRSLPPGVIAAGNPCRILRKLGEGD